MLGNKQLITSGRRKEWNEEMKWTRHWERKKRAGVRVKQETGHVALEIENRKKLLWNRHKCTVCSHVLPHRVLSQRQATYIP